MQPLMPRDIHLLEVNQYERDKEAYSNAESRDMEV